MTPVQNDPEAFESAVARLPYPVFMVDGVRRYRALNEHACTLFQREGMSAQGTLPDAHALSRAVERILADSADDTTAFALSNGERYEVIHSSPSPKGPGRLFLVMLQPYAAPRTVDRALLRRKWSLTLRETDIATACIYGQSTNEICESFSITRETFKTHMNRILSKAGCENRSQLLARYLFGET